MTNEEKHIEFLKNKSIDSFLLSIEIFNKPTINYRLEGCVFFLCNAWELMLKAKLLSDGESIYYPKSSRTLSLKDCAAKVMTNKKDPIRVNLDMIASLRNTATHDIIPEMEILYTPYLTFCVKAYADKMYKYLGINVSEYIKSDLLSLFTNNRRIDEAAILSKYGEDMKGIFDLKLDEVSNIHKDNPDMEIGYTINVNLHRVNKLNKADFTFYASNNPKDPNVMYVNRYLDPNETHTLTYHQVVDEVDKEIKRTGIKFVPVREPKPSDKNPDPNVFTTTCLNILNKAYDIKNNTDFCRKIKNGEQFIYKYSRQLVSYIISLIMDDPEIVIKNKK